MSAAAKKKKRKVLPAVFISAAIFLSVGIFVERAVDSISSLPDFETASIPENRFLILVNGKNSIPDGYSPELTELSNGERVDSEIYPDLQKMFDDMRAEDIYPVVGEGYRTEAEQLQLLEDKIRAFEKEGYSRKRSEKMAKEWVALPGTSEHELGLAVDINADKERSDNQEVYDWLYENAYKYGFIMRYPFGKSHITGIDYEPWHYRYVGECAEEIHNSGLCLEEWLEQSDD